MKKTLKQAMVLTYGPMTTDEFWHVLRNHQDKLPANIMRLYKNMVGEERG